MEINKNTHKRYKLMIKNHQEYITMPKLYQQTFSKTLQNVFPTFPKISSMVMLGKFLGNSSTHYQE